MYEIWVDGKRTYNGPFKTVEDARKHIQTLREFAMHKVRCGFDDYRNSFDALDRTEIKEIMESV